ncbi:hypothetical protein C8T65DRAFT_703154 [Cerioporus squamosus]|nr:hypothetical protein C8T65DRAFT_703154 [Cerioporus squamosus]
MYSQPSPAYGPASQPAAATSTTPASPTGPVTTQDGIPLSALGFNTIGVRRLRQFLGKGYVYSQFKHRFDVADLAWFVAGAHKDGAHFVHPDRFHPRWLEARLVEGNDSEVVYNVTMLDRVTGGASFLVHTPGTVEPGHRHELPFLKLDIYVPPFIFQENPLIDRPIASMVQTFAEEAALPITRRWRRAFEAQGLSLPRTDGVEVPEPPANLPFLPEPQRRSTLYRCRGRRAGELEQMLANAGDGTPTDRNGPGRREGHTRRPGRGERDEEVESLRRAHAEEVESLRREILDLLSTIDELEPLRLEIAQLSTAVDEKDAEINRLRGIIEDREIDIVRLQEELDEAPREERAASIAGDRLVLAAPTPTPSRASLASPLRAARPAPSITAPITAGVARSAASASRSGTPASPLALRLSSMSISSWSMADASSSSPPSPSPSHVVSPQTLQWMMPSPSRQSPVVMASPRPGPSRAPGLTRFDVIGPRTQAVLEASNLPPSLHRTLRDVVLLHPQSVWYNILTEELSGPSIVARPIEPKARNTAPTLTPEQRKKAADERKARQDAVEERISTWMCNTEAEAEDLAATYGKNEQYYLNLMFSGGPKLSAARRKSNPYNAWLHQQAGDGADVVELGKENVDYHSLSKEEKEELRSSLEQDKKDQMYGLRLSRKGRAKDVANACKKVEELRSSAQSPVQFTGIQSRDGVEGFYMIVRNTGDYTFKPRWWFSSKALDDYLRLSVRKFEPEKIGVLAEAFAISGSNFFAVLQNPKEKALHVKAEIRDYILEALRTITKKAHAAMSYVHFTRDIELVHRVTLVGWTADRFCNPSDLSNSIEELVKLRDALKTDTCRFVQLSDTEYAEVKQKYDEQVKAGLVPARKQRKDAGTKRKKTQAAPEEEGEGDDVESASGASKRARVDDVEATPTVTSG